MSISHYVYLIKGYKISREQAHVKTTKRGCDHSVPENAKFCPECGKPRTQTDEAIHDYFDGEKIIRNVRFVSIYRQEKFFIGKVISTVADYGQQWEKKISEEIEISTDEDIEHAIQKSGIKVSDAQFGLWLVMESN